MLVHWIPASEINELDLVAAMGTMSVRACVRFEKHSGNACSSPHK